MHIRGTRIYFASIAIFVTILVFSFIGLMNILSMKNSYTESLAASYGVAGKEAVRRIEYAVKYGKPLTIFYGMNELLSEVKEYTKDVSDIKVILPDGQIEYSLNNTTSSALPKELVNKAFPKTIDQNQINYTKYDKNYHIFLPIKDSSQNIIGVLDIIFSEYALNQQMSGYSNSIFLQLIIITSISIMLILTCCIFMPITKKNGLINNKGILASITIILVLGQIYFGFEGYAIFKKQYISKVKDNTLLVAKIVQNDVNAVLKKGSSINQLYGINSWLHQIVNSVSEIDGIYITDKTDKMIYGTNENINLVTNSNSRYNQKLPLLGDNGNILEHVSISQSRINHKLFDITLDTAITIVISFIFMTEGMFLMTLLIKKKEEALAKVKSDDKQKMLMKVRFMRPLAFLLMFASNMPTALIPLIMKNFNFKLGSLSQEIIAGLPISGQAMGTIISTILVGYLFKKTGWKRFFISGISILVIGTIFLGFSKNGQAFIASSFIVGIGYGFCWMSIRSMVGNNVFNDARILGFSLLGAGIMSGTNCGTVIGTMFADRLGYSMVFFISLIFYVAAAVFCILFTQNSNISTSLNRVPATYNNTSPKRLKKLSNMMAFLVMICLPTTICATFSTYIFPISAQNMSVSTSNIGRILLLNGLFVVYAGPLFGRIFKEPSKLKRAIILSSIIYAVSMFIFGVYVAVITSFIAVILLGVASSLGTPFQLNYFLNIGQLAQVELGTSLTIFSVFFKVSQFISPLILGTLITLGTNVGINIVGVITILLVIAYIIFTSNKKDLIGE